MIERRSVPRHRTLIQGRILFNNRQSTMDCVVRDLTDHGARLDCQENFALPDNFEVYLPHKDQFYEASVKWHNARSVGVSWRSELDIKQTPEKALTGENILDRVSRLEREVALLQRRLDAMQTNFA